MKSHPPALARFFIALALPSGPARSGVLGDLHEMYNERKTRDGTLKAALWYWKEAFHAVSRYTAERSRAQYRQSARPWR